MFTVFKQVPAPLQKQTLIRLGLGGVFLFLFMVLLFMRVNVFIWSPCAASVLLCAAAAFRMFRLAVLGEYVAVSGVCADVCLSAVKRRIKYILVKTEEYVVKVTLNGRIRNISVGSAVDLYLAKDTPIYEQNSQHVLYTYLAVEIDGRRK